MKIQFYFSKHFSSLLNITGKKPSSDIRGGKKKKEHFYLKQVVDDFVSWHLSFIKQEESNS